MPNLRAVPLDLAGTAEGEPVTFSGTYFHAPDYKGRVVVPRAFRDELGSSIIVAQVPDQRLVLLSKLRWTSLIAQGQPWWRDYWLANAYEHDLCPHTGRLWLPSENWNHVGGRGELALSGQGEVVMVAAAGVWRELNAQWEGQVRRLMEGSYVSACP
jgi:DNA-binding transcriptional regulator/RsmH inhibitor MraZ